MGDCVVRFTPGDLDRILGSLKQIPEMSKRNRGRFVWTLDILNEYKKVVISAMGSVKATGGNVHMYFNGKHASRYWDSLTDKTIEIYAEEFGYKKIPELDYLRGVFKIWQYTGETAGAVEAGTTNSPLFAGITDRYPEALRKASAMEQDSPSDYGTTIRSRKLFSVANKLFVDAMTSALSNPNSTLAKELTSEFISKIIVGLAGWSDKRATKDSQLRGDKAGKHNDVTYTDKDIQNKSQTDDFLRNMYK